MDMSTEIIAIDHGWSQIKTPSYIFTTGVKKIRNKMSYRIEALATSWGKYKIVNNIPDLSLLIKRWGYDIPLTIFLAGSEK